MGGRERPIPASGGATPCEGGGVDLDFDRCYGAVQSKDSRFEG